MVTHLPMTHAPFCTLAEHHKSAARDGQIEEREVLFGLSASPMLAVQNVPGASSRWSGRGQLSRGHAWIYVAKLVSPFCSVELSNPRLGQTTCESSQKDKTRASGIKISGEIYLRCAWDLLGICLDHSFPASGCAEQCFHTFTMFCDL